jgi:hypothetical protein
MDFNFEEHRVTDYPISQRHVLGSLNLSPLIPRVRLISPNLVSKFLSHREAADEVAGIQLAQRIGIRVPDVKRVFNVKHGVCFSMDRIHGMTLDGAWIQKGWVASIRMALQLRRYVRVMRSLTSPTAGALISGECHSIWLDDYYKLPPHATPENVTSFIRFWLHTPKQKRAPERTSSHNYQHLNPYILRLQPSRSCAT